jgi:hypothetical protein
MGVKKSVPEFLLAIANGMDFDLLFSVFEM